MMPLHYVRLMDLLPSSCIKSCVIAKESVHQTQEVASAVQACTQTHTGRACRHCCFLSALPVLVHSHTGRPHPSVTGDASVASCARRESNPGHKHGRLV